jgi:hypothetical protein
MNLVRYKLLITFILLGNGDSILRDLLTKQITHLHIDIKSTTMRCSKTISKIFALVSSLCEKLIDLSFSYFFNERPAYSIFAAYPLSTSCINSTLIKLKINVPTLTDCILLLDKHLDCLSTLIINVLDVIHLLPDIDPTVSTISMIMFSKENSKILK